MTVLVVSQVFPPRTGGSGRWLWELYRRFDPAHVAFVGGDVDGATTFDRASGFRTCRMSLDFASGGLFSLRGARRYIEAFLALRRIVHEQRPAALHCGTCLPEGLLALGLKTSLRLPYTCFVHGEELGLAATSREMALLTRQVLRGAQHIIANSDHSRRLLLDDWGVGAAQVVVMHPGVDVDRFTPAAPDDAMRSRFGWRGRRVILTVGALQKRKGQDMMIRALPAIRAACPDVLYAIVGEGWERPYLESLVAEHGVADVVQFRGVSSEDELVACHQQCDLFALPNRRVGWDFEGFGIALIEAQACGKAVIAGDSGGAPETLIPEATGALVDCREPGPLAAAAVRLLAASALREQWGASGREWVAEHFAWPALAAKAAAVFGLPLAEPPRHLS